MSVLSITFHATEAVLPQWENYAENELAQLAENLIDAERYLLSNVHSEMLNEGKNTNLLLVFDNFEKREDFLEIELKNIEERIAQKFGQEVMVFVTQLNPIKTRF